MSNPSPSIPIPVEPRPKRPIELSPLIGYGTNVDEKQAGEAPFLNEKLFYYSQPQTTPSPTYLPPYSAVAGASEEAYTKFLEDYPRMFFFSDLFEAQYSYTYRVPQDYYCRWTTSIGIHKIETQWRNLCRLYWRRVIPRKAAQGPPRVSEHKCPR